MTKRLSFAKYEQGVRPKLRERINSAESTEDVKKFFAYAVLELLEKVLRGKGAAEYEDIRLQPDHKDGYYVSDRVWSIEEFASAWNNSDLPHILKRMAQFAIKRYKRLDTHRDKTEAKMYHKEKDRYSSRGVSGASDVKKG